MIIGDTVYLTKYYYDEAGIRIRKMTYAYLGSISESEPPANSDVSNTSNRALRNDEVYSRDVSGKEMAIYKDNSLLEYTTYGLDMIGKIKDDELHFYLKDHLGSIRATVYDNKLMSAHDYDAWGYIYDERTYESSESKFKFTEKERDEESFYDYFGARYYDARIGRWGQVEPLFDKFPSITPYNYSLNNPLRLIDPNGADPFEIIVRTYIPFDVTFPGFKGDSRGADPNATSYRTEQRITVETNRSVSSEIIQSYNTIVAPSMSINPLGTNPPYLVGLGKGEFSAIASYSSDVNEGNNASVQFTGEAHVGVIPSALSPAIDYSFGITILPQKDGRIQVLLLGSHDKFPAYEIYVKDKSGEISTIYNHSPIDPIMRPLDLHPNWNFKQKVNSENVIP